MRSHDVLADTFVIETGETLSAGSTFTPASAAQRDRLVDAGCLRARAAPKKPAPQRDGDGGDIPLASEGTDTNPNEEA